MCPVSNVNDVPEPTVCSKGTGFPLSYQNERERRFTYATDEDASRLAPAHAGMVQLFSSRVGAITSRLSFGPGTGADSVKRSHLSLTCSGGLKVSVYISIIN